MAELGNRIFKIREIMHKFLRSGKEFQKFFNFTPVYNLWNPFKSDRETQWIEMNGSRIYFTEIFLEHLKTLFY